LDGGAAPAAVETTETKMRSAAVMAARVDLGK
jgi:hypothetical protein